MSDLIAQIQMAQRDAGEMAVIAHLDTKMANLRHADETPSETMFKPCDYADGGDHRGTVLRSEASKLMSEIDRLRAENFTFRNAQRACEHCDPAGHAAAVAAERERCAAILKARADKITAGAERAVKSEPEEVSALRAMAWQLTVAEREIRGA